MFGLLHDLVTSSHEDKELSPAFMAGGHVTFGRIPAKTLRQRRLLLAAAQTYLFDGEVFVAYCMETEGVRYQIIKSETEDGRAYLALSQKLNADIFAILFRDYTPSDWFGLEVGATLNVEQTFGALQGWLASSYTMVMQTHGSLYDGMRAQGQAKIFDYVLLVDEHNAFALEAERYADDTLRVFATMYRPATDIVRTEAAPPILSIVQPEEEVGEETKETEETTGQQHEENKQHRVIPAKAGIFSAIENVVAEVPTFTGMTNTSVKVDNTQILTCSVELAGRIIDEAKRNAMGLEALIRKVIDLPAHLHEEVWIPLTLSAEEYAVLAKRYDLPADAHEDIHRCIAEELSDFAGIRKGRKI